MPWLYALFLFQIHMAISITSEDKKEYLLIVSIGTLVTKEDLFKHAETIYAEIAKSKKQKILIEETETILPLSLFSYPDLVTYYQEHLPFEIRFLKIAVITSEKYKSVGDFWETVCNNKGFQYFAFTDFQSAHNWLTG